MDECFIRKGMINTAVITARFVIQIGCREAGWRFFEPQGLMEHV
jgi:hypothetical protein